MKASTGSYGRRGWASIRSPERDYRIHRGLSPATSLQAGDGDLSCDQMLHAPSPAETDPAATRHARHSPQSARRLAPCGAPVESSNDLFNEVLCRSMSDPHMLITSTPQGPLSLCRHSLVLDHVRSRRIDHRDADAVARSAHRPGRSAAARRLPGENPTIPPRTRSPERF